MADLKNNELVPTAINYGQWVIDEENNIVIDCYVTSNEKRVLSLRGTARAMGLKGGGSGALVRNLKAQWIQPYLSSDLKQWVEDMDNSQISSLNGAKKSFIPFQSELLVDLCRAYITAKNDGVFNTPKFASQSIVADKLLAIMSAFAKIGIVALIDEITGYQEDREKDELQKLLAIYVRKELLPWARRFPEEFYIELYRLRKWEYKGKPKSGYVGKLTNYLIYERLPQGVLEELQKRNPVDNKLHYRKNRHHQYLSETTGIPHLDKHLISIITLMRGCDTWEEFDKIFRKSFNLDYQLTFDDETSMSKE